jgi:hypothetical protein
MKQLLPAIVFGIVLASSSGCVVEPARVRIEPPVAVVVEPGYWHEGYWHEGCCLREHEREAFHQHHDNGRGHGGGHDRD